MQRLKLEKVGERMLPLIGKNYTSRGGMFRSTSTKLISMEEKGRGESIMDIKIIRNSENGNVCNLQKLIAKIIIIIIAKKIKLNKMKMIKFIKKRY